MLNKTRLLTPGPTPLPESVRLAMARDMMHHRKADFERIMTQVQARLKILFGTAGPVLPLSCSGTGAMTAAASSLLKPGEKVLVVEAGKFGQRWREIAISRGLEVTSLEIPWGEAVTAGQIADQLEKDKDIRAVFVQLCETSTGVLQPVWELAPITAKSNCLLIVDGISAVGISPCPMDKWQIDCLLTGSQKGLMLPPGLALIALSERAWQRAEKIQPGCYYFNLPAEKQILLKNQTHFTSPVSLIYGLDASLELLLENGLDAIYRHQWAMTCLVRTAAQAMGLELLARDCYSWGVTAIKMPDNVNGAEVLQTAQKKYGVYMAGGQDKLKKRIVRVGHMGWVDWADCMAGLYALKAGIIEAGGQLGDTAWQEDAMQAYNRALAEGYPQA